MPNISTHTLTWSVTCQICAKKLSGDISTHTLTWSVTRSAGVNGSTANYFNSHAHVERDQSGIELAFAKDISTHTLTWSVTNRFSEHP